MSGIGFSSASGVGSRSTAQAGGSAEGLDKIDMSLDDIIRLNRKEQKTREPGTGTLRLQANARFPQGRRLGSWAWGVPTKGRGAVRLGVRGQKIPLAVSQRRGQGVITGLAARRAAMLRRGVGRMNRNTLTQKPRVILQRWAASFRQTELQRWPFRHPDVQRGSAAVMAAVASQRPIQIGRRTAMSVPQAQKAARQATFLFHRGLKVHTQVQNPVTLSAVPSTRPWRTSATRSGILTVSIDNPCARTQPEPPRAWSLDPFVPSSPSLKEDDEVGEDSKPPKGVPLQFDINSVGRQTAMTLNERFRILKDQRAATAVQAGRSSRFVTVG